MYVPLGNLQIRGHRRRLTTGAGRAVLCNDLPRVVTTLDIDTGCLGYFWPIDGLPRELNTDESERGRVRRQGRTLLLTCLTRVGQAHPNLA